MVRKTIIALIDDLDGGTAAETVVFSVDGVCYEIDLSEENAERLRDALTEFVVAARRVNRPTPAVGNAVGSGTSRHPRPAARPARLRPRDTQQIRDWAPNNPPVPRRRRQPWMPTAAEIAMTSYRSGGLIVSQVVSRGRLCHASGAHLSIGRPVAYGTTSGVDRRPTRDHRAGLLGGVMVSRGGAVARQVRGAGNVGGQPRRPAPGSDRAVS